MGIDVKCRIWFEYEGLAFIAPGKSSLLKLIRETGSLSQAALKMNMSYRKAWYSVQQLNKNAPEPLVILSRGGNKGGRAILSNFGQKVLDQYETLCRDTAGFLSEQAKKLSL